MDKTELLKELIQNTGLNMRAFSEKADIPNTTLHSMLSRGVENASVNNVIKICKALGITVEDLYDMTETKSRNLSKEETTLLNNFNELNSSGKREANKRVAELTEISRYRSIEETDPYLMPIAAHTKEGARDEDIKSDIEKIKEIAKTLKDKK